MKRLILKWRTSLILALMLSVFSQSAFAQGTATPYQRKVAQVTLKYFNIFAAVPRKPHEPPKRATMEQWLTMTHGDTDAMSEMVGLAMIGYASKHGMARTKQIMQQMGVEIKAAEKLRTKADTQREKNKELAEQKERQEKEYANSDKGKVMAQVKQDFAAWCQKGEFEKAADAEERLKTQSEKAFNEICTKALTRYANAYAQQAILGNYDTEKERFFLGFKYRGNKNLDYTDGQSFADGVIGTCYYDVPVAEAPDFKKEFEGFHDWGGDYFGQYYIVSRWCFVNNFLVPKQLQLNFYIGGGQRAWTRVMDLTYYKFDKTGKPIAEWPMQEASIAFDDLGIDNAYLKGFVYKPSDGERKKSLEELEAEAEQDTTIYERREDVTRMPFLGKKTPYGNGEEYQFWEYFDKNWKFPDSWEGFINLRQEFPITFVVEKDGSLTHFGIGTSFQRQTYTKGSSRKKLFWNDSALIDATLRFVLGMPKWIPAKVEKEGSSFPVRFRTTLTFVFTYGSDGRLSVDYDSETCYLYKNRSLFGTAKEARRATNERRWRRGL